MYNILILLKVVHVLFVISWMVGVFYLPRIILHYKLALIAGEQTSRLQIMARRLFNFSIFTGLIATVTGLALATWIYHLQGVWLISKIMLVGVMWGYFLFTGIQSARIEENKVFGTSLFWRIYNESALIILILILLLIFYKPF